MRRAFTIGAILAAAAGAVRLMWPETDGGPIRIEKTEREPSSSVPPGLAAAPSTLWESPKVPARTEPTASDRALRTIRGRVADEHGHPVAGASVQSTSVLQLFGSGGSTPQQFVSATPLAVSEVDGRFMGLADELCSGITVAASAEWSASASTKFADADRDVTLVVTRIPNLTGTVLTADGSNAPGVDLRVRTSSMEPVAGGRSLDDGTFALRIPPGANVVDLIVGALETEPLCTLGIGVVVRSVTIPRAGLVVRLETPATLLGVVVGLDSTPVPAEVDVLRLDAEPVAFRTRVPAPDGTFSLACVRPGRYALRARPLTPTTGAVTEVAEINVPCNGVRLVVREPDTLRGRLIGEDVSGFRLLLIEDNTRFGREQRDTRTDAHGHFEFQGLHGPARIIARRMGDDRYADLVVTPGPADVEVTLVSGQRIDGRIVKGPPYNGARVLARQDGIEVDVLLEASGAFSLRGLAPGKWSLFVTKRIQGQGFGMEWGVDLRVQAEAGTTDVSIP